MAEVLRPASALGTDHHRFDDGQQFSHGERRHAERVTDCQRRRHVPADHSAGQHAQLAAKAADQVPDRPALICERTVQPRRAARTGDVGYIDEDGCYFITDRLKRMINASGYKVWPAECEMMLYSHPAVAECAVISAPDPRRGEQVRAVIALHHEHRGKVNADDIIAFARSKLAAYKVPRQIEFRDTLPRSGSRKIDWGALQAEAWKKGHKQRDGPA